MIVAPLMLIFHYIQSLLPDELVDKISEYAMSWEMYDDLINLKCREFTFEHQTMMSDLMVWVYLLSRHLYSHVNDVIITVLNIPRELYFYMIHYLKQKKTRTYVWIDERSFKQHRNIRIGNISARLKISTQPPVDKNRMTYNELLTTAWRLRRW